MPSPKYVLILPDGAADEPTPELGGKTPLEAAHKPAMDWIAVHGQQGRVVTVPDGFSPGSDVATLSLLGYDPRIHQPGRAPLEAAAQGIVTPDGNIIFRCNFVTIADGLMDDFTAGHISNREAQRLVNDLNNELSEEGCRFIHGVSYRNLMMLSEEEGHSVQCVPPHDIPSKPVELHLPRGPGAVRILRILARARALLLTHEINSVRRDLGENPVTDIWLWGQGRPAKLPPFQSIFGVRAAAIAAVDLIRGIARCAQIDVIDAPGATGYLDTDYASKGHCACKALDEYDLVIVHIEAPDEAGHQGDAQGKIQAIENIDKSIVGPLLEKLRSFEEWSILIAPDHPTPVGKRIHTNDAPPFCMAGMLTPAVLGRPFSEPAARMSSWLVDPGCELMDHFLRGRQKF